MSGFMSDKYRDFLQNLRYLASCRKSEFREIIYGGLGIPIVTDNKQIDNWMNAVGLMSASTVRKDVEFSLKNDEWIRNQCLTPEGQSFADSMISPFHEKQITTVESDSKFTSKKKAISFGLSSYGYDVTLSPKYKVFSVEHANAEGIFYIDPKNFHSDIYLEREAYEGIISIPPNSFILAKTNEYVRMPNNALAYLMNKSTYARCGITVSTTIIEPGWHGEIVLEIVNNTPLPVRLYANEGIGQLVFFVGDEPQEHYGKRNNGHGGKYQGQTGIQGPKI